MSSARRINMRVLGAVAVGAAVAVVLWFTVLGERVGPEGAASSAVGGLAPAVTAEANAGNDAGGGGADQASTDPAGDQSPSATEIELAPPPTAAPTPTAVPEPVPFRELIGWPAFEGVLASPLPDCQLTPGEPAPTLSGTVSLRCIEDWSAAEVVASGAGRVVHVGREPASDLATQLAVVDEPRFRWAGQAALGPHVVIDHGPVGGRRSVQTVYAGLDSIGEGIRIGLPVEAGAVLGTIAGPQATMLMSLWVDNVRQDGVVSVGVGADTESQRAIAGAVREIAASPTDPLCPITFGFAALPGAARAYRNGTHQGIDFGCGTADRFAASIADGTVVYLVDDYVDPSVPEREALLRNAGLAGFTPHWTLVMLYGNVVIVDHGEVGDTGVRMVSIAAHLETVDPAITLGATVRAGQVVGEIGNRGTNAAALGLRGAQDPSLHLHWELFFDDWYLGAGQDPAVVTELISSALCGAAATAGCP